MQYTSINDIPWPELGDEPDIESFGVKPAVEVLDNRVFPRFGSASSRNLKISSPVQGQVCYVTGLGPMIYSKDSLWVPFPGTIVAKLRVASFSLITNNTPYDVPFDTQDYIHFGGHSTVTNPTRFTPPFPGWYQISGTVGFPTDTAPNLYSVHVVTLKNGSWIPGGHAHADGSRDVTVHTTTTVTCNGTSDYLGIEALHDVGVDATPNDLCMSVTYLGPDYSG